MSDWTWGGGGEAQTLAQISYPKIGTFSIEATELNIFSTQTSGHFLHSLITCVSLEKKASNLKGLMFTSGYLSLQRELVRALFETAIGVCQISAMQCISFPAQTHSFSLI